MNILIKPAVALMNSIKYPKKLLLIAAITILVILVLIVQLVNVSLTSIQFTNKELQGVAYINPLVDLMKHMQTYRRLKTDYLTGDINIKGELFSEQDKIDAIIRLIDQKNSMYVSQFDTTNKWGNIKAEWNVAKNIEKSNNTIADSAIIANIQNAIVNACDNSNLTLDPDIDTYYLVDTYCTKLSNLAEELSLIHNLSNTSKKSHNVSIKDKEQLIIQKALIDNTDKPLIQKNIDKVLEQQPKLKGEFSTILQKLIGGINSAETFLTTTTLTNNFNYNAQDLFKAYSRPLDTAYELYAKVGSTLTDLLKVRNNHSLNFLYINLTIAIVFILLLIYLFIGMYISIIRGLQQLIDSSDKLASGDLTVNVNLETKDELVEVGASFNAMRDTLANVINETQKVVGGAVKGDLTKYINIIDIKGFAKELTSAVNQMTSTYQSVINEITRVLDAISRGDLTVRVKNEYEGTFGELKTFVNSTAESLQKLIRDIKIATVTIHNAASEISQGNNDLANRTEQQVKFIEEISSNIEKLTSTVKQNADNARQSNELAQSASNIAIQGGKTVNEVVQMMANLNESSRKVSETIGVIDGIAFQTNILALNAAVEAARAGEQGRGFAVVASEVHQLAQRASTSAKEIKALIVNSVESVINGTKLANDAGQTMEEVVKAVEHVTGNMGKIAMASVEQSNGIEQVNKAMNQMDQLTKKNMVLVEQAVNAASSMEMQTKHVDELVSIFKLGHNDKSTKNAKPNNDSNSGGVKKSDVPPISLDSSDSPKDEWEEF
jgi:methyl-accepting chemotaxis protein